MKKFLLFFVLLFSVMLFSGCSTTAQSTFVNTDVNSIYITITYNPENLIEMGIDSEAELNLIKSEIEAKSSAYMNQLLIKYRNIVNLLHAGGSINDNEKIIYKNHLNLYSGWDNETYIIELRFHTKTASRLFVKYGGEAKETEILERLFTNKITEEYSKIFTSTPNNLISSSVNNYYNEGLATVILNNFGEEIKNQFNDVTVNYMFLTANSRMHSNSSVVETSEGNLHCFVDKDEENVFVFYKVEANKYVWYLFALTITMIFIAIMLVYIYFKKDKIVVNAVLEDEIRLK